MKGQPLRWLPGHACRQSPVDYIVDHETGCWVWQLGTFGDKGGAYGKMTLKGGPRSGKKKVRAHRVYYERYVGPIPEGLELDHLCRNRLCVNPAHLEPVTRQENARRGCSPLNREDILAIRATTGPRADVARRYGIGVSTVTRIRSRRAHWDIEDPPDTNDTDGLASTSLRNLRHLDGSLRVPGVSRKTTRRAAA